MEISFKARYVHKAPIKVVAQNTYTDANIVRLDIHNNSDMQLVNRVANFYQKALDKNKNEYNYAKDIRENFNRLFNNPARRKNENFYALTVENINKDSEVHDMDVNKILGVAQVNDNPEDTNCELKYLQVDPTTYHRAVKRKYKSAGSAIWNSILKIFPKDIVLTYDDKALGFYIAQGCEGLSRDKLIHRHEINR